MSDLSSSSELPPHRIINVRLDETTARMLDIASSTQKQTRTFVASGAIRDWLTSPDRRKSVGGRLLDFQPALVSPLDADMVFSFPIWVRGMLLKACGSDITTWADVIRKSLEEMLPPLMDGEDLSELEARVRHEASREINAMLQEIQEIKDANPTDEQP